MQVIDELKKDNFSLKLKLHFYEQRLEKMAPSSVEQALRENIQLKVEFQTLRTELKRYKKLLLEGDKAIQALTAERDARATGRPVPPGTSASAREKDLERRLLEQEEQREQWERKARELHKQLRSAGDAEVSFGVLVVEALPCSRKVLTHSPNLGPPPATRRHGRRGRLA